MERPPKEEENRDGFGPFFVFNNPYTDSPPSLSLNSFSTIQDVVDSPSSSFSSSFDFLPDHAFSNSSLLPAGGGYETNHSTGAAGSSSTTTSVPIAAYGDIQVLVVDQPQVEVRTRTPNEKRTFTCAVHVLGDYASYQITHVGVEVGYAEPFSSQRPSQSILGGNKLVKIGNGGLAPFDDLSMCEASTKHKGYEFQLEFFLCTADGRRVTSECNAVSRAFYAFSNQKVLARRRNVELRALSKARGVARGGELMHVIGSPFISSPSLQVRIWTSHGELSVHAANIELYSESVLFFPLPPYPLPPPLPDGLELRAQVRVSNDGRHFSNPLEFTYYVEPNNNLKRLRSRF